MIDYKLNYIYIDDQNMKSIGVIRLSKHDAQNIEVVKQKVVTRKSSSTLFLLPDLSHNLNLNLVMVDSKFPEILEKVLSQTQQDHYLTSTVLCKKLKAKNPLGLSHNYEHSIYEYKWKQFLLALGSGFNENEVWTSNFKGVEHHVIFTQIADMMTPQFVSPEQFAEYLFQNTIIIWSDDFGLLIKII